MTRNRDKRYPVAIDDLLIEFDEMDYCPMNLRGSDPVKEALAWRDKLKYELDLLLDEKSAIERRAVEEFAEKLQKELPCRDYTFSGITYSMVLTSNIKYVIDKLLKEYENDN